MNKRWKIEHSRDPYVKEARINKLVSRAAYKLEEIHQKYKIIKPGMTVIDLGAHPGGWVQIVQKYLYNNGRIIAVDLVPIKLIENVEFICGDLRLPETIQMIERKIELNKADLVLSDLSPNLTGVKMIDQAKMFELGYIALRIALNFLKRGGDFLLKFFQGHEFEKYFKKLKNIFTNVIICKPKASLSKSSEIYLLARDMQ